MRRVGRLGAWCVLWVAASSVTVRGQETDFEAKQQEILARLARTGSSTRDVAVHQPPLIDAAQSDLADDEPVIGVALGGESKAYPLTMLFGGAGIFELLNDTCGGEPIAPSW
jgi:hypothetical protein